MACADPAKFPEAVKAAGITMEQDLRAVTLERKPSRHKEMRRSENWNQILKTTIEEITARRTSKFQTEQ